MPLAKLVGEIESVLELATPATRGPVAARWARFRELGSGDVGPYEEHGAYLDRNGQAAVDETFAAAMRALGPKEVGVYAMWLPNFVAAGPGGRARDSLSMIGLSESTRSDAARVAHRIVFESNTCFSGVTWFSAELAVPYAEVTPAFEAFAAELHCRLGVRHDRRRWLLRTPVKNRYKVTNAFAGPGT